MDIVKLAGRSPVAVGTNRMVYEHADDPALLVKLMRPEVLAARQASRSLRHRLKRGRPLASFAREIREQLVLIGKGEDARRFLQTVVGFCETDQGPGMLVRAIRSADGGLAPSLLELVRRGALDADARRDLDAFFDAILASDIIVAGLTARNVLYGSDDGGKPRFVIVDAYGDLALLSWRGALPALNRRWKQQRIAALRSWIAETRGGRRERKRPPAAEARTAKSAGREAVQPAQHPPRPPAGST